jgi:hypothetical protein
MKTVVLAVMTYKARNQYPPLSQNAAKINAGASILVAKSLEPSTPCVVDSSGKLHRVFHITNAGQLLRFATVA